MRTSTACIRSSILSLGAALFLALAPPASAGPPVGPSGVSLPVGQDAFAIQVAKAEAGDPATDFTALRMGWMPSEARKHRADAFEAESALVGAFRARHYEEARDLARKVLASDYTSIRAHQVLRLSCAKLGDGPCVEHEGFVINGLLNSIKASGDGKTMATAWVVISIEEEYAITDSLGMQVGMQSLLNDKGHMYDMLEGTLPGAGKASFYFNIDAFFSHELE